MIETATALDLRVIQRPPSVTAKCMSFHSASSKMAQSWRASPSKESVTPQSDLMQMYICPICREASARLQDFVQHMAQHMTTNDFCGNNAIQVPNAYSMKTTEQDGALAERSQQNLREPHEDNHWNCKICGSQLLRDEQVVMNHIKLQHVRQLFQCSICEEIISSKDDCTNHVYLQHLRGKWSDLPTLKWKPELHRPSCDRSNSERSGSNNYNMKDDHLVSEMEVPDPYNVGFRNGDPSCRLHLSWISQLLKRIGVLQARTNLHQELKLGEHKQSEIMQKNEKEETAPNCQPNEVPDKDRKDSKPVCKRVAPFTNHAHTKRKRLLSEHSPTDRCALLSASSFVPPLVDSVNHWIFSHPVRQLLPMEVASRLIGSEAAKLCHLCLEEFEDEMSVLQHQVQVHRMEENSGHETCVTRR